MSQDVLIIIQARLGSTRLPGKVLLDLGGQPVLARMIERLRLIKTPVRLLVATTTDRQDDPIVTLCRHLDVQVFRGHPTDLLDRHYRAAIAAGAEAVAKIPSDCPLIDPDVIDQVLDRFMQSDCDYVSNLHPASWPDGNDVEVMRLDALETAWREAMLPMEREHTTPYLRERPERFKLANVRWDEEAAVTRDCSFSHRWTLDYAEDYAFIRQVFETLYPENPAFGVEDILDLLASRPQLADINERYLGVNWYRHHLHQLKTVDSRHTAHLSSLKV